MEREKKFQRFEEVVVTESWESAEGLREGMEVREWTGDGVGGTFVGPVLMGEGIGLGGLGVVEKKPPVRREVSVEEMLDAIVVAVVAEAEDSEECVRFMGVAVNSEGLFWFWTTPPPEMTTGLRRCRK